MAAARAEDWYYCVRCARAWSAAAWQAMHGACPSSAGSRWPEFHPYIGWSYVAPALGVTEPVEGGQYLLDPEAIAGIR